MDVPADQIVSLTDAAERLGCSQPYLSRESKRPDFPEPITTAGRSRLFDMRAIQAWWDARPGSGNRTPR